MIKSMTGFGTNDIMLQNGTTLSCYIKTLNHKYLDISTRVPPELQKYEAEIVKRLKKSFKRGKITIQISFTNDESKTSEMKLNIKKARLYYNLLLRLKNEFALEEDINLSHLVKFSNIFEKSNIDSLPSKTVRNLINKVVLDSLSKVTQYRQKEGMVIYNDFKNRIKAMKKKLSYIKTGATDNVSLSRKLLNKKIRALELDTDFDQKRLQQEILLHAIKSDIMEECVRLDHHFSQFANLLESNSPAGKKLTFLIQEMIREITTLNAKAQDNTIKKKAAKIREEIEHLREQAYNIE